MTGDVLPRCSTSGWPTARCARPPPQPLPCPRVPAPAASRTPRDPGPEGRPPSPMERANPPPAVRAHSGQHRGIPVVSPRLKHRVKVPLVSVVVLPPPNPLLPTFDLCSRRLDRSARARSSRPCDGRAGVGGVRPALCRALLGQVHGGRGGRRRVWAGEKNADAPPRSRGRHRRVTSEPRKTPTRHLGDDPAPTPTKGDVIK